MHLSCTAHNWVYAVLLRTLHILQATAFVGDVHSGSSLEGGCGGDSYLHAMCLQPACGLGSQHGAKLCASLLDAGIDTLAPWIHQSNAAVWGKPVHRVPLRMLVLCKSIR